MNAAVKERYVEVFGGRCRILEKGSGETVGVIAGHNGLPRWTPFLDALSKERHVCLMSPPGFPGSDEHHNGLDSHLDWVASTLDLLEAAGVAGADLVAASIGCMLAADAAACCPGSVRRLSLTGPYGIYTTSHPVTDVHARTPEQQRELLCADGEKFDAAFECPEDADDSEEYEIAMYRAATAGVRLIWPFGDRGLAKRLHRIRVPVQLIWGEQDRVVPRAYADLYRRGIAGSTSLREIAGAGHLAWIDRPEECADAVLAFLK